MKKSSIWCYFIFLFIALGFGVWEFFGNDTSTGRKGNIQLLAKIVVCCCYLIFALVLWPKFKVFQQAGGITGTEDTKNLTSDKIASVFKSSKDWVLKTAAKGVEKGLAKEDKGEIKSAHEYKKKESEKSLLADHKDIEKN
jgi:hypothetical protein